MIVTLFSLKLLKTLQTNCAPQSQKMDLFKEDNTLRIKKYLKKFGNFLRSKQSREFLLFVFFVFIASSFWMLRTLNDSYNLKLSVPLKLKNVPNELVITSGVPDHLEISVHDRGSVLVGYLWKKDLSQIELDFNKFKSQGNNIKIPAIELGKEITKQLATSTMLQDVSPDTIEIIYTLGQGKKVPVHTNIETSTQRQYYITGKKITPDSVMAYAPANLLDVLHEAQTEKIILSDIADTVNLSAKIKPTKGIKFVPDHVRITYYSDILTEKSVVVPITGIGFPEGKQLKTFPSKATLTFLVGMHQFKSINANDFAINIAYNELPQTTTEEKIQLQVTKSPAEATRIRIRPESVEFLIEKTEQ